MKKLNRDIDVLATFRVGEPPEPHKFRVRDRYENIHVLKVGQILDIKKERVTYHRARLMIKEELENGKHNM